MWSAEGFFRGIRMRAAATQTQARFSVCRKQPSPQIGLRRLVDDGPPAFGQKTR